ncbi:MAG: amidohydrolase family protein [Salinigranum sp.]
MSNATPKQKPDKVREGMKIEDTLVVDADVHLSPNHPDNLRALAEHMEPPFDKFLAPDNPWISSMTNSGWAKTYGGHKDMEVDAVTSPEPIEDIVMDEYGVDYAIINSFGFPDKTPHTEYDMARMRAFNDMMLDRYLDDSDNIYGLATISSRKPDKAAEEIDRIGGEDKIVGCYFQVGLEYQMYNPPGDPNWDVMYQAMADNDLVPTYHISEMNYAPHLRGLETFMAVHNLCCPWSVEWTLTSLMEHGTFEKFPELDFVFLEGGVGWIPFMMARLNREVAQFRHEVPLLEKTAEEYIRDQCYFGTQPIGEFNNPEFMVQMLRMIGADSLMYTTDYPHHDFDHPNAIDKFLKRAFDEEDREKVLNRNAIDVYDLPV